MIVVVENGHGNPSSNPGQSCCISHSTNTLGVGINLTDLLSAMSKL